MANTTTRSPASKSLTFALGRNVRSANVENISCESMPELRMFLRAHRTESKGRDYICVAPMEGTRRAANAQPTRLVGLDYDSLRAGEDMEIVTRLRELGLSAVYWMTHSHTPQHPRMRILVELDREIPALEYRSAWLKVAATIGNFEADSSTSHSDQPLFLPGLSALVVHMPGRPFIVGETVQVIEKGHDFELRHPPDRVNDAERRLLERRSIKSVLQKRSEYPSESDFDFALFMEIARVVGRDPNKIYHLAWNSGARREKWNRTDYVKRTIDSVLAELGPPIPLDIGDLGMSAADFQKQRPAAKEWILPGLLVRGGTSFIVGRPKGGKSTLALQMGMAAAGATDLWRTWDSCGFSLPTKKHHVMYLDLEQSDGLAWDSIDRLKIARWPNEFRRRNHMGTLDEQGLEVLEGLIDQARTDLVILDTWLRVDPSDLMEGRNIFTKQGVAVQRVTEISHRKNIHIALLVHAGKRSDPGDPSIQIAGTSAMAASVDDIIAVSYAGTPTMEEDSELASRRIITLMGRHYANSGSAFVMERQNGRLEMLGPENQVLRNTRWQTILDVLADGQAYSTSDVAEMTGMTRQAASRTLYQLESDGRVERAERRAWRLAR